jgi:cardiolipin synthase C
MNLFQRLIFLLALCALSACTHLPKAQQQWVKEHVQQSRSKEVAECSAAPCRLDSPLLQQAAQNIADSTNGEKHHVYLLDYGQDSLLSRVHLIRSARETIELQTFIFDQDDAGHLVLAELLAASKRGVKVRVLLDQLYGLPDPALQAALATYHQNFELRLYNPTFGEAKTQDLQFAAGILCCFKRFNQRMHSKLLLVDSKAAVLGGRNFQDRYFDWSGVYNYRDRDILVSGPIGAQLRENFEAFWNNELSVPAEQLKDVQQRLVKYQGAPEHALPEVKDHSDRAKQLLQRAEQGEQVFAQLKPYGYAVGAVEFYGDLPAKHSKSEQAYSDASAAMQALVAETKNEMVLQTPYLVMSKPARRLFRSMKKREQPPRILVSTNSLAATDAFPVYAMSHKYKRLYLRELGFQIHEFKPFPATAALDVNAMQSGTSDKEESIRTLRFGSSGSQGGIVPLKSAGIRVGLHAKSFVIDDNIAVVGSHNFDPRSDNYNTESMLVVRDAAFARALKTSIENDMKPDNAWVIAGKPKTPVVGQLSYNLGKLSEKLPIFDLWPFSYASSYELKPGCSPLPPGHPQFRECYRDVGDFPEVDLPSKSIYTRILTAFGAGLVPIL